MSETVAVPEVMKNKILQLQSNMLVAQAIFNAYLEGCQHGLQLEGDWNLDLTKWLFEPIKKEDQEK